MYTEYVFNSKKYDVASREIKATMFDIVASEEAKIGKLRDLAFGGDIDPEKASQLQDLYVKQEDLLREFLKRGQVFCKKLQELDNCTKTFKQIESGKKVVEVKEPTKENQEAAIAAENSVAVSPAEEIFDEGDALAAKEAQELEAQAESNPEPVISNPLIPIEEPVDTKEENVEPVESVEQNVSASQESQEEQVNESDSIGDNNLEVANTDSVDNNLQTADNNSEPLMVQDNIQVTEDFNAGADEVKVDEVSPVPLIVDSYPEEGNPSEGGSNEVKNEVVDNNDTIPSASEPILSPIEENDTPEIVVQGENVLDPVMTTEDVVENMPVIQEEPITQQTSDVVNTGLTFKKRGAEAPKVIMINADQAYKLRSSLLTQEALLSGAGFFKKPEDSSLESQLISNGLLAPDISAAQAQIEGMMEQANALYTSGKVEEAQAMYDKISELNKQLQGESAGITR